MGAHLPALSRSPATPRQGISQKTSQGDFWTECLSSIAPHGFVPRTSRQTWSRGKKCQLFWSARRTRPRCTQEVRNESRSVIRSPFSYSRKFDSSNLSLEWGTFRRNHSCVPPNFVRKFAAEIFPGQWGGEEEEREGGREGERRGGGEEGAGRTSDKIGVQCSVAENFQTELFTRFRCGKSSPRQNRLQNSAAEKSASKTENIQQSEVSKKKLLRTSKEKKRKHEKPKIYEENTKNFQMNTKENPRRAKKHQERPSSPDACRATKQPYHVPAEAAHVV